MKLFDQTLLHGVESRANLAIRRPLPIILLDNGPFDAPGSVKYIHRRVWDPFELRAVIRVVKEAIRVDRSMARIREQQRIYRALAVLCDTFSKQSALVRTVNAYGENTNRFAGIEKASELGQLPGTVRSPVPPIKDEHRGLCATRV